MKGRIVAEIYAIGSLGAGDHNFLLCERKEALTRTPKQDRQSLRAVLPELGNRPARCRNRQRAKHAADQSCFGSTEQRCAAAGNDRAKSVGCLRKNG